MGFRKTSSNIVVGLTNDHSLVSVTLEPVKGISMAVMIKEAVRRGAEDIVELSPVMVSAKLSPASVPLLSNVAEVNVKPLKQTRNLGQRRK